MAIGAQDGVVSSALLRNTQASNPSTSGKSTGTEDVAREDFLTLLVAQLQNQDPLDPMDAANFTAQLAQFSSLEQLVQINQKLGEEGAKPAIDGFAALGLLGHEGSFETDRLEVSEGAGELGFRLAQGGNVKVEVTDLAGNVVATKDLGTLDAGEHSFGAGSTDTPLANGAYLVKVSVVDAAGAATEVETFYEGKITGVDLDSTEPAVLVGGRRFALTDVRQIRASEES